VAIGVSFIFGFRSAMLDGAISGPLEGAVSATLAGADGRSADLWADSVAEQNPPHEYDCPLSENRPKVSDVRQA